MQQPRHHAMTKPSGKVVRSFRNMTAFWWREGVPDTVQTQTDATVGDLTDATVGDLQSAV